VEQFERSYFMMSTPELEVHETAMSIERLLDRNDLSEPLRGMLSGALAAIREWSP